MTRSWDAFEPAWVRDFAVPKAAAMDRLAGWYV